MTIKVAINGYGTIGKRVADAVACQDDMEIIGVTKTRPAFGCDLAVRKGYPLYCTFDNPEKIAAFAPAGYECHGGLSDLLAVADIVIDCSPGKLGAENKAKYQAAVVHTTRSGNRVHRKIYGQQPNGDLFTTENARSRFFLLLFYNAYICGQYW